MLPMNMSATKERILTEAESLIQHKGYNAFSFKDISNAIGIKTASIHYHFPSKEDLGLAVIAWHTDKISGALNQISDGEALSAKMKILSLFEAVLSLTYKNDNKLCLGGMFASDVSSLPSSIQRKAKQFFEIIIEWIKEILIKNGCEEASSLLLSKQIMSHIEGALLLARLYQDETFLDGARHFIEYSIK
jgi:TetR/AcrR family transcriptional regulator, transcriptional repressor for nem operon